MSASKKILLTGFFFFFCNNAYNARLVWAAMSMLCLKLEDCDATECGIFFGLLDRFIHLLHDKGRVGDMFIASPGENFFC